ncbi:MAG: hypothetical protein AB7U82_19075 [Blastocatellales bacterium]
MTKQKSRKANQSEARVATPTAQDVEQGSNATWRRRVWIACLAGALLIFLAIYLLRLDPVVGLFVDDAWYALLAKSLATGQGYQLINSPSPGIHPVYPPVFPFLLSLAYRVIPTFPDNVWLLKSVSIMAMAGVGWASFRHFTRDRKWPEPLSLIAAFTITMMPELVFLATSSLMSECVFTLLQLLAVISIEAGMREENGGRRYILLGAALAVAAFLTRSIGLAIIAACVVYLLKERKWRLALVFATVVILLAGSWMIYSRLRAPTPDQRAEQSGMIVQNYTDQFWQRRAGTSSSGVIRSHELTDRFWSNAMEIIGNNAAMLFTPTFYRSPKLSGEESLEKGDSAKTFSYVLSLLIIIGFATSLRRKIMLADLIVAFTLLITIAWPWDTFRFLVPLTPFLLFYLIESLREIHGFAKRRTHVKLHPEPWRALAVFAGCLLALYLFDHVGYLRARGDQSPAEYLPWRVIYDENRAALDWIREKAPEDAVVASENPAMVYLYTGRKSVAIDDPGGNWENWKRLNVRYLARLSVYTMADPAMDEGRFNMPFRSKGPLKLRVTDLGPKENRRPWNPYAAPGGIKIENFQ